MIFSENTIIYLDSHALQSAMANAVNVLALEAAHDGTTTAIDHCLHTQGNFEQRHFSAHILRSAGQGFEALLTREYRNRDKIAWAKTQNDLGNILAALAQRQQDVNLYGKAKNCFHQALDVFTREQSPQSWAETKYNLGTVNQALGCMLSDTKPLKVAVAAYTDALSVWSRHISPENWMRTMHQLGATFHIYGKLLAGNRLFQKSVVAYKNALAVLDADDYALALTATHNNRGAVLQHLGESEENPARIEEATRSYDKALTVSLEQQLPIHLAVICRINKATAQNTSAELNSDIVLAEALVDEFDVIIECFSHLLQPLYLTHCEQQRDKAKAQILLTKKAG